MHLPRTPGFGRELNPRRGLMRVLTVAKWTRATMRCARRSLQRASGDGSTGDVHVRHRHGNHPVVLAGVHERALHQIEPKLERRSTLAGKFLKHSGVILGMHDDEHITKILGGGAKKTWTADVDLLHQRVEGRVRVV